MPRWYEWGYSVARILGLLIYQIPTYWKNAVLVNIRDLVGPSAPTELVNELSKSAFINWIFTWYELVCIRYLKKQELLSQVKISGLNHVESAINRGKGVIIASLHYGPLFLVTQILPILGISTSYLQSPFRSNWFVNFVNSSVSTNGLDRIEIGKDRIPLEAARVLRRGEALMVAIDWDPTKTGSLSSLMNTKIRFPIGHIRLSEMTGAPIIFAISKREKHNRYSFTFSPIKLANSTNSNFDLKLEYLIKEINRVIRSDISQWSRLLWHELRE